MEAGRLAAVSKQLKALKAEQFKKGQQLFGLRNQERELTSEINGSNAQNKNLSHKLHKLDEKVILAASAVRGVHSCCQACVSTYDLDFVFMACCCTLSVTSHHL